MDSIDIRQGETVTLPFQIDDTTADSATLYVGKLGERPIFSIPAGVYIGQGVFEIGSEDTIVPVGKYVYQITIGYPTGEQEKFPEVDDCDDCSYPEFNVHRALDVVS